MLFVTFFHQLQFLFLLIVSDTPRELLSSFQKFQIIDFPHPYSISKIIQYKLFLLYSLFLIFDLFDLIEALFSHSAGNLNKFRFLIHLIKIKDFHLQLYDFEFIYLFEFFRFSISLFLPPKFVFLIHSILYHKHSLCLFISPLPQLKFALF